MNGSLARNANHPYLDIKIIGMRPDPSNSNESPRWQARWCRGLAILVTLVVSGYWWAKGAHMGWSQNLIPKVTIDEVTGLEHITYQSGYIPGIDLVAIGAASGLFLWLGSLFFGRRTQNKKYQ